MSDIPFWVKGSKGENNVWEYLNKNADWIMIDEIASWYINLNLPKRKNIHKVTFDYFIKARSEANNLKMAITEHFEIHKDANNKSLKYLNKAAKGISCLQNLDFLSDLSYYYVTEDSWHPITYVVLAHFANTVVQEVTTLFHLDMEPTPNPKREPYEVENFGISLQLYISDLPYSVKANIIRATFHRLLAINGGRGETICKNLAHAFKEKERAEYGYNKTLDLLREIYVHVVNDGNNIDDMYVKFKDADHLYDLVKFIIFMGIGHLARFYRSFKFDISRSKEFAEHNKELDIFLGYHSSEDEEESDIEAGYVNEANVMSKLEEDRILSIVENLDGWNKVHEEAKKKDVQIPCRCPDCTQEDFYFHD